MMEVKELIDNLKYCQDPKSDCSDCERWDYGCAGNNCVDDLLYRAAVALESLQNRICELETELRDERHRHDRYVDFELAEAEELRKLKEERRWISVTERLPEESGTYIVCCDDSGCPMDEGIWYQSGVVVCAECEVYRNSVGWTWYENGTEYELEGIVTHWMPLPEAPKEGE